MDIIYTKHAEEMLVFRGITKAKVKKCIKNPDKILTVKEGKKAYLRNFGKNYLKVIVFEERDYFVVITLYWLEKARVKG